jgi:hypothetical protein
VSTVWHHGVPWYSKAFAAAERRGPEFVEAIETVAESYRHDAGSFAVGPEIDARTGVAYENRVRVTANGHSAVISQPDGVVIGFGVPTPEDRARSRQAAAGRIIGRGKGRKATRRGPKDFDELVAWLKSDGYATSITDGGHTAVNNAEGQRVYVMPTTASDHRSLANCVADIRRLTGLELRR